MPRSVPSRVPAKAFTLIELLVVISIISLLISILMPSLSRAREQAKSVHCAARLKDMGNALAAYENVSVVLPPARWNPAPTDLEGEPPCRVEYGWSEILFGYIYREEINVPISYAVQRNLDPRRWEKYFVCQAVGEFGPSSGHYRVYLPAWSAGTYMLDRDGRWGEDTKADPRAGVNRDRIRVKLPLIGDANDRSERGDGVGGDDCSFIDAGEANIAGSSGINGNRFSDRHYGGTNFLYQDLHASWDNKLRDELARDYDLNGIIDIEIVP